MSEDEKKELAAPKKKKRGNINGTMGKQFTSEYQPSPESKRLGRLKKRTLKDLSNLVISSEHIGGKAVIKFVATFLGIPEEEVKEEHITMEMAMHLRQLEKAIKTGDTYAWNSLMDRIYGRAKQTIGVEGSVQHKIDLSGLSVQELRMLQEIKMKAIQEAEVVDDEEGK